MIVKLIMYSYIYDKNILLTKKLLGIIGYLPYKKGNLPTKFWKGLISFFSKSLKRLIVTNLQTTSNFREAKI